MNQCVFLGKLKSKELTVYENIEKVDLLIQIENKRKAKGDFKKMDYETLNFEAWGTAAISIFKNLQVDDYILVVNSTARNSKDGVCFRINEFKIIKKEN